MGPGYTRNFFAKYENTSVKLFSFLGGKMSGHTVPQIVFTQPPKKFQEFEVGKRAFFDKFFHLGQLPNFLRDAP